MQIVPFLYFVKKRPMRYALLTLLFVANSILAQEPYLSNETYTYDEVIAQYQALAAKYPDQAKIIQFGKSDYGKNIPLFLLSKEGSFKPNQFEDKVVIFINNGIHPGEPCGVDACVNLSKKLLKDPELLPENVVIGLIPLYNVGGAHNRTCCSRANQNGPAEYGFRGNAKNLDLNRDFIKSDSKNTFTFYRIFHYLNPHIFIDTHTSDGADYQHTMTLITSQLDKMQEDLRSFVKDTMNPAIFSEMLKAENPMVPYVHQMGKTPEEGIFDYLETPRYSTGYTNLFNCISYVSEAHMLKSFKERVEATQLLLEIMIAFAEKHQHQLKALKKRADLKTGKQQSFELNWQLDTTQYDEIPFMGYEAEFTTSSITGEKKLTYNHDKPWKKKIRYYNTFTCTDSVIAPNYYILPKAWNTVAFRLQKSGVQVERLTKDTSLNVAVYYIDDYTTTDRPYEGHYLHKKITVTNETKTINYQRGDYVINVNCPQARMIVESLEPQAPDSYFAWNFFDAILQQKEWFSAYVFEEKAEKMLAEDSALKKEFELKKKNDADFAADPFMQLYFLYKRSDNYERTANLYPVGRLFDQLNQDDLDPAPLILGF